MKKTTKRIIVFIVVVTLFGAITSGLSEPSTPDRTVEECVYEKLGNVSFDDVEKIGKESYHVYAEGQRCTVTFHNGRKECATNCIPFKN